MKMLNKRMIICMQTNSGPEVYGWNYEEETDIERVEREANAAYLKLNDLEWFPGGQQMLLSHIYEEDKDGILEDLAGILKRNGYNYSKEDIMGTSLDAWGERFISWSDTNEGKTSTLNPNPDWAIAYVNRVPEPDDSTRAVTEIDQKVENFG